MALTIFYSWQSDTSNKVNHDLIEEALEGVGNDLELQEALREEALEVDRETKGVPGSPPIVQTIFEKISKCSVFVPDLTFVGKTNAKEPEKVRLLQNPNVLVEYGWALKAVTHARIVPVMNAAFGAPSPENMPFDMRHVKFPITYNLGEKATPEEREAQKKKLAQELEDAIKLVLKKILLIPK